jgi:hypothetical protein
MAANNKQQGQPYNNQHTGEQTSKAMETTMHPAKQPAGQSHRDVPERFILV